METEDTMKTEKKVYSAPELVEHGNFIEMTQAGGQDGWDGLEASSGSHAPIPF